jgi:phosphonate transport system substrate-binding protein
LSARFWKTALKVDPFTADLLTAKKGTRMNQQNTSWSLPLAIGLLIFVCGLVTGVLAQPAAAPEAKNNIPLKVAVSAMISPKSTFVYYKEMLDVLGSKMGRKIQLVQRKTYAEVNELLEKKEVDLAFVCAGPYVTGKKEFGLELLVAPMAYGETVYYSYIIVNKESRFQNFSQLKNQKFAFTDPQSNTGYMVPTYQLSLMGETPSEYFKKYIFTGGHDNSIKAVAKNLVDGAAVDHLIWEYAQATDSRFTAQTRIIAKFGPFGMPPIVVHPEMDDPTKEQLRQIFLAMHEDARSKKIINKLHIDKFVLVDDSSYGSVREMEKWLSKKGSEH